MDFSHVIQVMLVVLCAIRKMLECIFTKRELRLLDDLLPEAGMGVRRGRSPHKHKHKRHNSGADMELAEELTVGQIRNWRQLVLTHSRASVFTIGLHYRVLIRDAINLCLKDHCSYVNSIISLTSLLLKYLAKIFGGIES